MNPSRTRAWLAAALIFFVGLITGGGLTALLGVRFVRQGAQLPGLGFAPERAATRIGREIAAQLDLSPELAAAVQDELDRSAIRIRQARLRHARDVLRETRAALERVAETLPPEKRGPFRDLVRERIEKLGLRPESRP